MRTVKVFIVLTMAAVAITGATAKAESSFLVDGLIHGPKEDRVRNEHNTIDTHNHAISRPRRLLAIGCAIVSTLTVPKSHGASACLNQ